jgi:hypothetical protein
MPMHEQARMFQVRIYPSDWENDDSPTLHIERIGAEGISPPPLEPAAGQGSGANVELGSQVCRALEPVHRPGREARGAEPNRRSEYAAGGRGEYQIRQVYTVMVFATAAKFQIEPVLDFVLLGTGFQLIQFALVGTAIGWIHGRREAAEL